MKDIGRRAVWLATLIGVSVAAAWAGPRLRSSAGPFVLGVVAFGGLTIYWWFTMWFLLAGRVQWRKLVPSAIATGLFWIGMEAVFSIIFSNTVISDHKKYGEIGVIFALMSWLIAIGVVIILGAVVGVIWREQDLSFARALRWIRGDRTPSKT